jgi:tetratricopeptide (TPR) repeat protein
MHGETTERSDAQNTIERQGQWWSTVLTLHGRGEWDAARALLAQGMAQGLAHPLAASLRCCLDDSARSDDALLTLLRAGLANVALPHAMAQTVRCPDDAAAWMLAGLAQRAVGNVSQAEDCARQALALAPSHVEAHYNLANLLRARHETAQAEQHYRAALAVDPNHLASLNNLSLLLDDLGRYDEAVSCLQRALQLQPTFPELHNNLGQVWARLGRWQQALACHLRAIELAPTLTWSYQGAALACQELGQFEPARQYWRQALQHDPGAVEAWQALIALTCRQGNPQEALRVCDQALAHCPAELALRCRQADVLFQLGQYEKAEAAWCQVLDQVPSHPRACHGRGLILAARGRHDSAMDWLTRALASGGPSAGLSNDLGNCCFALDRLVEAEAYLRQALALDAHHADAAGNLGNVLRAAGRDDQAEACYRQALGLRPDHAEACCNLACLLLEAGRQAEGELLMDKALRLAPAHAGILASALQYLPYRSDDVRFAALEDLYDRRDRLPPPVQARLAFALGRAREQCGQYDQAFAAFAEGNRLRARMQPWDEASEIARLAELQTRLTPALFAAFDAVDDEAPVTPDDLRVPIFIVGMPRSGSSLVEQILVSQGEVFGAGEQRLMGPLLEQALRLLTTQPADADTLHSLRALGRRYKEQLWRLAPQARYIADKMPGNVFYMGLIHLMLPEARFVHTVRDLRDACLSCFTVPFHAGHGYSDDLTMLARHALRYQNISRYWLRVLPPGRVHNVNYEALVADLPAMIKPLLAYLGLSWNESCLQFHRATRTVRTASAMQVKQPLYRSSVGRWRRFEAQLAPLLNILSSAPQE